MPKVSVIMAAYNAAAYIGQALDSVIAQVLEDIEIILVDDGSTDTTYDIMEAYASKDKRIQVLVHHEETAGGGEARNLGMSVASGEYISVLDADDIFEPEMLAHAYAKAQETGAEIVMFDGDIYDDSRQCRQPCGFILRQANLPDGDDFTPQEAGGRLFQLTIGSAWNLLIKRELVERENLRFESLHNSNDTTFVLLALALARKLAVWNEKLILYRRNHRQGNGIHETLPQYPLDVCEALWRVRQGLEQRGIYGIYRMAFVRRALELALLYLRRKAEDWPLFVRMYEALQKDYVKKLDFACISEADIGEAFTSAQRCLLMHCSAETFAAGTMGGVQMSEEASAVPAGARVAVYGAGDKGADFFHQVYRAKKWQIVCWADRNYERLGWPIVSPKTLVEANPEYVLVAIENRKVCAAVSRDLERLGVAPGCIRPALQPERGMML